MFPHIKDFKGKRVHFIGIGGCSMSELAKLLKKQGYIITGSDKMESSKTKALVSKGMPVVIGHFRESVHNADLVVYTAAIAKDNPEREEVARLNIPNMERAVLLGQIMEGYPYAINVSGTHGKTTTTSMISQAFVEVGADPTVHIGGELDALGGGTIVGGDQFFIVEACEFNASFLNFHPKVAVILNIEEDHLDFYRDLNHITDTFKEFAALLPKDGWCVGNGDDQEVQKVLSSVTCNKLTFGLSKNNDWYPENVKYDSVGKASFTAVHKGEPVAEIAMAVPGEYSMMNALATIATASIFNFDMQSIAATLSHYKNAHRRFELTGTIDGVAIYHDYGHNPTEIKNAIKVASMQPHNTLWAVWQPHTYSRTKKLFDDFITTFDVPDKVLITDIYAAREKDPGDIHTTMLLPHLAARNVVVHYTPTFDDAEAFLRANWQSGDLVITLGCGNIDMLNDQMNEHGDSK